MAIAVYIVVMARKMSFDTAERKLLLKSQKTNTTFTFLHKRTASKNKQNSVAKIVFINFDCL
jgi:hypothetical protein